MTEFGSTGSPTGSLSTPVHQATRPLEPWFFCKWCGVYRCRGDCDESVAESDRRSSVARARPPVTTSERCPLCDTPHSYCDCQERKPTERVL